MRSEDAGVSWQLVQAGRVHAAPAVDTPQATWWLLEAGLMRSTDQGRSWELVQVFEQAFWGPFPAPDGRRLLVVDGQGAHSPPVSGRAVLRTPTPTHSEIQDRDHWVLIAMPPDN